MRLKINIFVVGIALMFLGSVDAFACSCAGPPTVQEAFEASPNVFVAKITKMDKDPKGYDGIKGARVMVQKVFKGTLKPGDEVFFYQGNGVNCINTYRDSNVGAEILAYVNLNEHKQGALSFCGRRQDITSAAEDLAFLENLDKLAGKTRVSGSFGVIPWYRDEAAKHFPATSKIKIYNDVKTYEVQTNKDGFYEIYDLPPGNYYVEPDIPIGYAPNRYFTQLEYMGKAIFSSEWPAKKFQIRVEAGRHTGVNFVFEAHNPVYGTVIGPDGKPMAGVWLALSEAGDKSGKYASLGQDSTDDQGRFLISELMPGNYVLYANGGNEISASQPFERLFFPGVFEREKAVTFSVPLGGITSELILKVPSVRATVELKGQLIYANGIPIGNKSIEFKADKIDGRIDGDSMTKTDQNGNFVLKLLKGVKGNLYPQFSVYQSDTPDCPPVDKVIEQRRKSPKFSWYDVRKPTVKVDTNSPAKNILIKLDFDGCAEKK